MSSVNPVRTVSSVADQRKSVPQGAADPQPIVVDRSRLYRRGGSLWDELGIEQGGGELMPPGPLGGMPSGATSKAPLTGIHAAYLAQHPDREERIRANRDGNALDLAMSRDANEQGAESSAWYREWYAAERAKDSAPQPVSALANYRPGSALAQSVGQDRDGAER